jgi:urea transporter
MTLVDTWRRLTDRNPAVEYVDMCLRGVAQVMLQNNPLTGLIILIGIGVGAFASGNPRLLGGAVVGVAVGTATALLLRADRDSLRQGLFGFSPLLTAIGVLLFLRPDPIVWLYVVFGAAATTVVTLALTTVLNTWGVPALTFPFVLVTWALLFGAYQFDVLRLKTSTPPALPGQTGARSAYLGSDALGGMVEGVAQVYLIGSWIAGAIILIGLLVNSVRAAIFAFLASVVAALIAIWFGAGAISVEQGLWGFNAVLTGIALGAVFYRPTPTAMIYAVFGIVATVYVQAALTTLLSPYGIPTLTAPFVITTWLFLLSKRTFRPVAQHRRVEESIFTPLQPAAKKPRS